MRRLTIFGMAVALITLVLAFPAAAQDRSSDLSFGFAGRAEYNKPVASGSSAAAEVLPETGGIPLILALAAGGTLVGGAFLARRGPSVRRRVLRR